MVALNTGVIVLPGDPQIIEFLKAKLAEYKKRYNPYKPPERQQDAFLKILMLQELKNGRVQPDVLRQQMQRLCGEYFVLKSFLNAWGVVEDYCLTGGKHTVHIDG